MLIHVYHRLVSLDLLVHVDFEFGDCHQISPAQIIEVHDTRVLAIIIVKHGSNKIFIADGHVHKILSMPRPNATRDVQVMLVEI